MNNSYDRASGPFAVKVVFDIDGTLAKINHRLHHIIEGEKDWKAFHDGIPNDIPNDSVITLLRIMKTAGYRIILSTGRFEKGRERTEKWLAKHLIFHHDLFMRPNGDFRPDHGRKDNLIHPVVFPVPLRS